MFVHMWWPAVSTSEGDFGAAVCINLCTCNYDRFQIETLWDYLVDLTSFSLAAGGSKSDPGISVLKVSEHDTSDVLQYNLIIWYISRRS